MKQSWPECYLTRSPSDKCTLATERKRGEFLSWLSQQYTWHTLFTTIVQLVHSMIWPMTIVILASLFRTELREISTRLARLKFRDFEADFREELIKAEGLPGPKESAAPSAPKKTVYEMDIQNRNRNAAPSPEGILSPREMIRRAWSNLDRSSAAHQGSHALVDAGAINSAGVVQIERLRALARMVERNPDWIPCRGDAERYAQLASRLASRLSEVQS